MVCKELGFSNGKAVAILNMGGGCYSAKMSLLPLCVLVPSCFHCQESHEVGTRKRPHPHGQCILYWKRRYTALMSVRRHVFIFACRARVQESSRIVQLKLIPDLVFVDLLSSFVP